MLDAIATLFTTTRIAAVKTADGPLKVRNGRVKAPDLPGLGITPRLDVLGEPVASYC